MSDTASYKKALTHSYLFRFLNYDVIVSKIDATNMPDRDLKNIQVNEAKHTMECRPSANETEYETVSRTPTEGNDDVTGTIHPGEAQPESDQALMSLSPM